MMHKRLTATVKSDPDIEGIAPLPYYKRKKPDKMHLVKKIGQKFPMNRISNNDVYYSVTGILAY